MTFPLKDALLPLTTFPLKNALLPRPKREGSGRGRRQSRPTHDQAQVR